MIMSARKILLSVIIIFTFLSVVAQNKCTVSGLVSDKNGEPVYCASVVLYDGNKVIAGGITNERGGFNLIFPRSAKTYRLVVEFIGYSKKEMDIAVSSSSVNVGKILI